MAPRGCHRDTCRQGCRAKDPSEDPLRHARMSLRYLWAGCPCRSADRSPLRHAGMSLRYLSAGWPWRRPSRSHLRHARMPLRHLWAGSPCRRPVRSPVRHARVLLRYLWARSPCQRADLELNPNLSVHEKGSNHGQTRFESPNPSLNSTIFIILAKSGVSTRAPYPMYGVFSQKAYLRRLLQDASDFRSRR